MSIDERIDKMFGELQLLAQVSASHESNINRLFDLQARNGELMAKVVEAINDLGRVALSHERRISGLEGGRA